MTPSRMLARSVIVNLLGSAASLVLGFVSSALIARWLGPADRGLLALLQSVSALALAVASVGIPMSVLYYASRPNASTQRLLGTSFAVAAALGAVLLPLTAVLAGPLSDAFGRGHGGMLWLLAAALVPITFLDWTTHNQVLGQLRFGLFNTLTIIGKAASVVAAVVLVGVLGLGVAGGLVAVIVASVVMIAGCVPVLLRDGRPRFDRSLLGLLTRYGARVQLDNIFRNVNYRLDVVILQFFRPLSAVGYYVVAQVIAELVLVLAGSFQSSVIPLVAGSEGADRDRTTILAVRHHGLLAAAACIADAGVGTALIAFAYGHAYTPAIVPMLVLLPGIWWLGTGSVITSDLRGRGRPGTASAISGVAMVVTIALDFALIPPFGVLGGAIASVAAYTTQGVVGVAVLSRVSGIPVRTLIVPDRNDLAAYRTAARSLAGRLRPTSAPC